ncbi:plasmid maintenance protein CcdB [Sphingobium lactosutens]|uniref:CcdB family protein n=1 Tax=Sphingobium lactosutens TaxID=522773 RepID=UPI0015BA7D97|nr:CcdB family protein [Sphingobium lactosutens]NWK95154.1 plasmid maintenance protein CcdB [Sphingobium lactosutens]
MARLCAHRLPDGTYVLDCQSDLLDHLTTRFVVPLVPIEHIETPMARLNPRFEIDGRQLVMMTQFASAIPARALGKIVKPLHDERYAISTALDMLIAGY